jgi:hypothetical protein
MNRKQLIFILIALAVIGSAGLVLYNQHRDQWSHLGAKMGDKALPDFRPNDVAAIHVKGMSEASVVHKSDGWRVTERDDYPANFGKISDLLIKLQGLKVVEADNVGPSQLSRVNLDEPGGGPASGILVEFKDAQGKVLEAVLLGKKHFKDQGEISRAVVNSDPDGRYILSRKDPRTVLLISDALVGFEPRPEAWVNRDFFKAEHVKSLAHIVPNAAECWKISRENESADWMLENAKPGETLDTRQVGSIAETLKTPGFNDVFPGSAIAGTGLENPMTVAIETFDHFSYTLKIGVRGNEEIYHVMVNVTADIPTARVPGKDEKPDDAKKLDSDFREQTKKLQDKLKQEQTLASWIYTVNSWLLEGAIHDRSYILGSHPEEPATNTAAAGQEKSRATWTPRVIH